MLTTEPPIITQEYFNNTISEVWSAITNCKQMTLWYFDNIPSFQPKVGFKTQFNVTSNTRNFLHLWEVVEVAPLKKITINWKYKNIPGSANVTFEISETNSTIQLTVTCIVLENFPQNIPEFKTESCKGGWQYFIHHRLKNYLNNTPI